MGVRVLVCDDQALIRAGLRVMLAAHVDLEVVGEADEGCQVVAAARHLNPDVVVIDITMLAGIESQGVARLAGHDGLLSSGMVVLADRTHATEDQLEAALRTGARGLVRKEGPTEEMIRAIRVVAADEALVAPPFTRRLLDRFAGRIPVTELPSLASLTTREHQVLVLVAEGMSNNEIAAALSVCESTVKYHMSGILTKLGLRDRAQAVAVAFRAGLMER
jgi:DNA-binding NarL/FixJ family response regulator